MSIGGSIVKGIQEERNRLSEIRQISDYIIDTSSLKSSQLKSVISAILEQQQQQVNLTLNILSFGYKHGITLDADNVFDVRFIPNPFYLRSLKKLTGNNKKVQDYVLRWPETQEFIQRTYDMIQYLIPYYIKQGKSSLVIAFGCTGGQHRSVTIANRFYEMLLNDGYRVTITHKEL